MRLGPSFSSLAPPGVDLADDLIGELGGDLGGHSPFRALGVLDDAMVSTGFLNPQLVKTFVIIVYFTE